MNISLAKTTKLNETLPELFTESTLIYKVISITIATLILFINGLVLLLIYNRPRLLRSLSNKIVLSLVVSDLVTGACMVLHNVGSNIPNLVDPRTSLEYTYRVFVDIITLWLQLVTMGNLCLVIAERYIALIYPYAIQKYITKRKVKCAILIIWVGLFFYPCIQLFWVYNVLDGEFSEEEEYISRADSTFSSISILIFVILPITTLFFAFVKMFREIKAFPNFDIIKKHKEEKRTIIIFGIMYILFVLFSLPYFLIRLMIDLRVTFTLTPLTLQAIYLLKHFPPILNPFVYVFNKPDFRRELNSNKERLGKYFMTNTTIPRSASVSRSPSNEINHHLSNEHNRNNNNICISQNLLQIQTIRNHAETRV